MMVIIVVPRTPAVMPFPAPAWANRICAAFDIGHILQDRPKGTAAAFDHLNDGSEHHPSTGLIFSCGGFGRQQSGKQLFHNDFFYLGIFSTASTDARDIHPVRRRVPSPFQALSRKGRGVRKGRYAKPLSHCGMRR